MSVKKKVLIIIILVTYYIFGAYALLNLKKDSMRIHSSDYTLSVPGGTPHIVHAYRKATLIEALKDTDKKFWLVDVIIWPKEIDSLIKLLNNKIFN